MYLVQPFFYIKVTTIFRVKSKTSRNDVQLSTPDGTKSKLYPQQDQKLKISIK